MKPYVELFIDKQKVYFSNPPEISFNFSFSDLHTPTIVKNSYSQTIEIEGIPENNRIFGCFFINDRITDYKDGEYTGAYFNPSRKTDFILMRNGEPVERGYVKLDKVTKKGNDIKYSVTLYGGLGQFLYGLKYKEDGTQMKLSDLDYGYDLDMVVTKEVVKDAWNHINGITSSGGTSILSETDSVYDFINFAPCYNGVPDNFTADKVAIDINSFGTDYDNNGTYEGNAPELRKQFVDTNGEFSAVNGWVMGELERDYDEWQTKDLRSYLQRPVIRLKKIIEGICDSVNNGGYQVDLDADFFSSSNPYYENAWITMPLLTEIEELAGENQDDVSIEGTTITFSNKQEGDNITLSVDFKLIGNATAGKGQLQTGVFAAYYGNINPAAQFNTARYVQVVIYDANGNIVGGSGAKAFYSPIKGAVDFTYDLEYDSTIDKVTGYFEEGNGVYEFNGQSYTLMTNTVKYTEGMYAKVIEKTASIAKYGSYDSGLYTVDGNYSYKVGEEVFYGFDSPKIYETLGGVRITKETILNTEQSPADYFLDIIKMFHLHIWTDEVDKKVYVRTMGNYFNGEKYIIENLLDRGQNFTITPLTFDSKWLDFKSPYVDDAVLYKNYYDAYGIPYGIQKIDTNYNFDSSSKSLFENSVYKGAVMSRGKSRYYVDIETFDAILPPYCLDGFQTFLFNSAGNTAEGSYFTPKTSETSVGWFDELYYDITPKPSFISKDGKSVDGSNVLLFYDGYKETKNVEGGDLNIYLSDDIPEFDTLNDGEPMWIWSMDWDIVTPVKRLPIFSRYITNENNWVTHSMDFGTPRMIYIPDYQIDESSSIYTQFWQNYITDRYDVDTRVVDVDAVLRERVLGDWLKRLYWFDNSWWVLNEIKQYNPTSNSTTKCQFVKVNDISVYGG